MFFVNYQNCAEAVNAVTFSQLGTQPQATTADTDFEIHEQNSSSQRNPYKSYSLIILR